MILRFSIFGCLFQIIFPFLYLGALVERGQCRTNTSDMSWKAHKQEHKCDVIEQDLELCNDTQLGSRKHILRVLPHDYKVLKGL
jgi:hypothetical protein